MSELRDIAALRQNTPSIGRRVYLNHASASLPPARVSAALAAGVEAESTLGTNDALRSHASELAAARQQAAAFLGAKPHNIAFVDETALAWSMALGALTRAGTQTRLVTVRNEWSSNILTALSLAKRDLVSFDVLPTLSNGRFDPKRIASAARDADVVSVPLIPCSSGLVNPVVALKSLLPSDALLFIDAAQAAGQVPLDVEALGADFLAFPLRKWLRGPRGIAVLYLSDRALARMADPPFIDQAGVIWVDDDSFAPNEDASRFEKFDDYPGLRLALRAATGAGG